MIPNNLLRAVPISSPRSILDTSKGDFAYALFFEIRPQRQGQDLAAGFLRMRQNVFRVEGRVTV
jgi:hypothetical protein